MSGCPHCGKDARAEDRFCTRCGTGLGVDSLSVLARPISTEGAVRRGSQRGLAGAAVVAVLAVMSYVVWAGLGSDPAVPPVDDPQTTLAPPGDNLGQGAADLPFGHPVELILFVGGDERVLAIDLRTGARTNVPVMGQPLALSGRWLVATNDPFAQLPQAVHLDLSTVTHVDRFLAPVVPMTEPNEPGRAWLLSLAGGLGLEWIDLDLESGEVVESIPAPPTAWVRPFGPAIASSPAGGVFARQGDTYQRVHHGTLVAASHDRALVRTCLGPSQCELTWYATADWTPREEAVPTVPVSDSVALSANGRLLGFTSTDGRIHLFDTQTGADHVLHDASQLTVAPDGSHAAAVVEGGVLLFSVDDGQEVRLDLAESASRGLLLASTSDGPGAGGP